MGGENQAENVQVDGLACLLSTAVMLLPGMVQTPAGRQKLQLCCVVPSTAGCGVGLGGLLGLELLLSVLGDPWRRFLLGPVTCSTASLLQPKQKAVQKQRQ